MRVKNSPNLKYDKTSKLLTNAEDYEPLDFMPRVCILESFKKDDDSLVLYFKNSTHAYLKAKNTEGMKEINLIESKLPQMINHSYEEILEIDI
jgi:hypothetical protein